MELPRDHNGLLILKETGELVSSADLPEAKTADIVAIDDGDERLALVESVDLGPSISVDLAGDLSLDEDISLAAPPPPPPAPRASAPAPTAPAAFSFGPPPAPPAPIVPVDRPSHDSPPPRMDSRPPILMGTPVVGTPVAAPPPPPPPTRSAGRTVADSGLKPLAPRVVGLAPAQEKPAVAIAPRRTSVGPRAIKERDRRTHSEIEAPMSPLAPASASAPATKPTAPSQVSKAQACYEQALADHRAGNQVAAENGLKLAVTYAPGEARFKLALERLRAGQSLEP